MALPPLSPWLALEPVWFSPQSALNVRASVEEWCAEAAPSFEAVPAASAEPALR
jgi:hypothetical protein